MVASLKRIGFIATGDELINGDILNTNGQYFCQQLIQQGMIPGQQVCVGDNEQDIQHAIEFLQPQHDAIITIGGLGPTVDDRTRYGLANALGLSLEFYEPAWQWIVDKITSLGYKTVPETNRQQALLPQGSEALQNHQGTAAACYIHHGERDYFMLPGPPNECRPLFDDVVIKKLIERHYQRKVFRKSWLLIGASEGQMASELEPLMQAFEDCQLGYRVGYPYLEIKLVSENSTAIEKLSQKFSALFANILVSEERQTASEQLQNFILTSQQHLTIEDHATHGALLHQLITPEIYPYLSHKKDNCLIQVTGLENYWGNQKEITHCPITLTLRRQQYTQQLELNIPFRGPRTLLIAVERICWEILKSLQ